MKTKLIAICIIGLMIFASTGILAANTQKNVITASDNHNTLVKHQPLAGTGKVLFSFLKVNAKENKQTNTGGYALFYLLIAGGSHDVAWKLDYTIWNDSGAHKHGTQNGVGKTMNLGPIQISWVRTTNNWEDNTYGRYQAGLFVDGNETNNDSDQGNEYDGEFSVDAGDDFYGAVGEPIQFNGIVLGGVAPYSWFWDFQDGNTSTEQNPIHTFSSVGQYEVQLTVTDGSGQNQSADDNIQANIGINESNNFYADAGGEYEGAVGEPIQFYGFAEGGFYPYTYFWDFGDGNTSTEQNPTHTYTQEGQYEALLTVTDATNQTADDNANVIIGTE
jgi:PKD repeat protein